MAYPPPFAGYPPRDYLGSLERERAAAPGWEPGYTRVWREGRDITDDDPSTWPWPWNPDRRPGHSCARFAA